MFQYYPYRFRNRLLEFLGQAFLKLRGCNPCRLDSDDRNFDLVLDPLERLGEIPRMGIAIGSRWQILNFQFGDLPWFRTVIGNIDNDEFLRHFRIEQGKNKVRAPKAGIYY